MSGTSTWQPLPLSTSPGTPVLLVSADFGSAAYTIHVTDMVNVWVESLDRKTICMRGWSENTSIDPSDTAENMAKFLTSLGSALDASQPGHDQTSLSLAPASNQDAGEGGLTLNITCPLPGFEPLKWPVYLKKSPHWAIATEVVLPLIQAHHSRKQEVESLAQALKHKDDILTKLLDKLEATGTGLEHVFTSLSGRKKVARSVAEDKVNGLAPFDRRKWKASLDNGGDEPTSVNDLVQDVFGDIGLRCRNAIEADQALKLDKWWHDFKGAKPLAHRSQTRAAPRKEQTASPPPPSKYADDDDFQVQSTPPHLKSSGKRAAPAVADDASTADEDVAPALDDKTPAASGKSNPPAETKKPVSRMGIIGRKRQPEMPRPPSPETSPPKPKASHPTVDDSETASEAEDDDPTASLPDSSPPTAQAPAPAAKKRVMGRIGGRAAQNSATETPNQPQPEDADASKPTSSAPATKKLGVIGKKIGGTPTAPSSSTEDSTARGRQTARDEAPVKEQQPRETSQERADRRREELKRDLERKAAAGPAKKKRRF